MLVTVSGEGLTAARSAELLNGASGVIATTTTLTASSSGSTLTATFGHVAPGLYGVKVLSGSQATLAATTGTPLEVAPAVPLFSTTPVDMIGNVPGIATTHIYDVSNIGMVDGVAVLLFTFPAYLAGQPTFDLAAAPAGSEVLSQGLGPNGYYSYVAVPIHAGAAADLAFTTTVPPAAVFGSNPVAPNGFSFPVVDSLVGQLTASEWSAAAGAPPATLLADSVRDGMGDFTSALQAVSSMPAANIATWVDGLADPVVGAALGQLGQSIVDDEAVWYEGANDDLAPTTAPAPPSGSPAPPSSAAAGESLAESYGNFAYGTGLALADGYGTASGTAVQSSVTSGATIPSFDVGSNMPVLTGGLTKFGGGYMTTAGEEATGGVDTSTSWTTSSVWDSTSSAAPSSQWYSGIAGSLGLHVPAGGVAAAGLPFYQSNASESYAETSVAFSPLGTSSFASSALASRLASHELRGHVGHTRHGTRTGTSRSPRSAASSTDRSTRPLKPRTRRRERSSRRQR